VVKTQGLEPNPSVYFYQRLRVGHCEGGVEAPCPDLILASVGTFFTGSAKNGGKMAEM